jgi:3-oxoacid CoA-transferase subunit B
MIITDLGVFKRDDHGSNFQLVELSPGVSLADVSAKTSAIYEVAL